MIRTLPSGRLRTGALGPVAAMAIAACTPEPQPVEDVRPVHVVKVEPGGAQSQVSYTGDVRARY